MVSRLSLAAVAAMLVALAAPAQARAQAGSPPPGDYVVGAQDVLTITSYDQPDLSGKFAVETDGTFTYPLIGRFRAGGLTLRQVEETLRKRLVDEGFFRNPQISAAVETYKSQRVFVVGEVRNPGTYTLSGNMTLIEIIARAGSTLPSATGDVVRVSLRDLENGIFSQNALLRDGDTLFVPRGESIYVFGQVRNPGAYAVQQKNTTVLQALSLAGGVTDRGSTSRIRIVRIVNGERTEQRASLTDRVQAGDTLVVPQRFF
jgi:polysaccharide biosynthesis/export protein